VIAYDKHNSCDSNQIMLSNKNRQVFVVSFYWVKSAVCDGLVYALFFINVVNLCLHNCDRVEPVISSFMNVINNIHSLLRSFISSGAAVDCWQSFDVPPAYRQR